MKNNIWKILKENIGKDLTKFSVPGNYISLIILKKLI